MIRDPVATVDLCSLDASMGEGTEVKGVAVKHTARPLNPSLCSITHGCTQVLEYVWVLRTMSTCADTIRVLCPTCALPFGQSHVAGTGHEMTCPACDVVISSDYRSHHHSTPRESG